MREAFCELAAITPADGSHLRAISEANPALKAELHRVFDAVGTQLAGRRADRCAPDSDAAVVAEVTVSVGFSLLGMAFRETVSIPPGTTVSPARLREYFDVLAASP